MEIPAPQTYLKKSFTDESSYPEITELRKREEELIISRSILLSTIESQKGTNIFSLDRNYNYLVFNTEHKAVMKLSYDKDIELGMNFLDCITSEADRRTVKNDLDRTFKGESVSRIESYGDYNRAYYEVFSNPILNERREIIGCTIMARNITERRMAEEALKDSEFKFKEIINQINDAIIVFEEDGKIIIWNKGSEELYGLKAEETLNKNIVDVLVHLVPPPNNNREEIEKGIRSIVNQEHPETYNHILENEIISTGTKKLKNIQSRIFPIELDGIRLLCSVIRDTTEIKRYEKEILRISSDKDKFYSLIAQYLYTPFNVFKDFSKLMAEDLDNLPIKEIHKMALMMSKSATNLYSLLDNLLQWTRMNQGIIPFDPQKLNLKKVCQDAVSVLKPDNGSEESKVNFFIEDEVFVHADLFMLKTIIRNLVLGAIRFSNSVGEVDILAKKTASEVMISIWNNSDGTDTQDLKKLFDISQIQNGIGAVEEKGLTLGLLLSKEFVEKHGGKVWVESNMGKGSEFRITLPMQG